ncbi:hypothetical protein LINPERHAP2_LOCUS7463, partial [Linum perenne]
GSTGVPPLVVNPKTSPLVNLYTGSSQGIPESEDGSFRDNEVYSTSTMRTIQ